MAGKRRATSELNSDNWDCEEPSEEVGVFTKASEDVLKKRVFKTARRRIPKPSEEGSLNAFNPASLANLTSKSNQPATQLFSFLSDIKPDVSKTNGVSNKPSNQGDGNKLDTAALFSFGNKMEKPENKATTSFGNTTEKKEEKVNTMFSFGDNNMKVDNKTSALPPFGFGSSRNTEKFEPGENPSVISGNKLGMVTTQGKKTNVDHYYARLKGLNESVAKWINKHVEDNALINLQPIFKDYERFFEEIEKEYHKSNTGGLNTKGDVQKENKGSSLSSNQTEKEATTPISSFKFSASPMGNTPSSNKLELPNTSLFKFGGSNSTAKNIFPEKKESISSPNSFKFDATNTSNDTPINKGEQSFKFAASTTSEVPNAKSPATFGFGGSSTGFSGFSFTPNPISPSGSINFGSIPSSTPSNNGDNKDEEESEEPPKVEIKEVEEEGHIYTIRCKLFIKKDGNFVEKGIGSLFLKPVPESDKIQVIVRAHNSLANVLCNFILSKSVPTQRMGKNNVMIVCIPTPESKPPPIPVLIKVKTGEEADQLLETLETHKK